MSEQSSAPARKPGHKMAAIALALVSTIVAIGIFNRFSPSQARLRECIAMGGGANNQCNPPSLAMGAIVLVLLVGWGAAARAWRNE
jgi:protein-S-isoprenylcysteine O-methyltransferase Ste14